MAESDWLTPGATVAEYVRYGIDAHVNIVTVDRLTATQVVLDNGSRYTRDGSKQIGGDGRRRELLPLDSPAVRDVIARKALSSLRFRVDELCKDNRGDAAAVLGALDEVTALVAAARDAITGGQDR